LVKIGFWKRAIAIIIDIFFLDIATKISLYPLERNMDFDELQVADLLGGMGLMQSKEFLLYFILYASAGLVLSIVYFTYFHGSAGQTLGKELLKIKVIKTSGEPINYKSAFIRCLGYFISELAMFAGFIWVILDKNKQGWHDKIAGTYVVKV
jgi:uncharacterized RDD family membrane protein YckC